MKHLSLLDYISNKRFCSEDNDNVASRRRLQGDADTFAC